MEQFLSTCGWKLLKYKHIQAHLLTALNIQVQNALVLSQIEHLRPPHISVSYFLVITPWKCVTGGTA